MKKLFLGLTIVASVMGMGFETKADMSSSRKMPEVASSNSYKYDASASNYNVILDGNFDKEAAEATFKAINDYRVAKLGNNAVLTWDNDLTIAAQKRAEEANVYYNHKRPCGIARDFNETLYTGFGSELLKSLKEQADSNSGDKGAHYNALMNSTATKCGIAAYKNSDGNFRLAVLTDAKDYGYENFSVDSYNYSGVDINVSWFWGLALQDEYVADDSNVTSNFKAYTKSTKQFIPAILSTDQIGNDDDWNLSYQYQGKSYQTPTARYISPSNVTFESLNTDILTIDENGVMQGKKAGTATVRVTLKPQDGVTFKEFTMKSVDYSVEVLAGGLVEKTVQASPLSPATSYYEFEADEEETPAVQPTTTVIEEQTIESKTETTTTEQATTQAKKTETKKTTTTTKTTTKKDNYKPAAPLKVKASKKGKKVTVKYGNVYKATSYEIQISTSKKFKSAKSVVITGTSKTIKVKSSWTKKTMYVRVRAINGTKKSSWSAVKKIKK